jgi:hypothetical protein
MATSALNKLMSLRKTYSRIVIAKACGVSVPVVDRSLKTGEVKNEDLAKALASVSETKLDKLKEEITGKRGNRSGAPRKTKTAKPAKKAKAKSAKPRTRKPKQPAATTTTNGAGETTSPAA